MLTLAEKGGRRNLTNGDITDKNALQRAKLNVILKSSYIDNFGPILYFTEEEKNLSVRKMG